MSFCKGMLSKYNSSTNFKNCITILGQYNLILNSNFIPTRYLRPIYTVLLDTEVFVYVKFNFALACY